MNSAGFHSTHQMEAALLGACLRDAAVAARVAQRLRPSDFTDPAHAAVCEAAFAAVSAGLAPDPLSVAADLARNGVGAALGGEAGVARVLDKLTESAARPEAVEGYLLALSRDARVRRLARLGQQLTGIATGPYAQSDRVLADALRVIDEALNHAASGRQSPMSATTEVTARWIKERQAGLQPGIPTGLRHLDAMIGGMRPGQLLLIAGRAKMGKSAVAGAITLNAARNGVPVLVVTMEMAPWQWTVRWVAAESGIPCRRLMADQLGDQEVAQAQLALDRFAGLPIKWIEDRSLSVSDLAAEVRAARTTWKPSVVVIDHIGLLADVVRGRDPVKDLGDVAKKLRRLAQEASIPVLALAQLSRAVEQRHNRRPQMHDLRASGDLEQDADVVMMLYRDSYYFEPGTPIDTQTLEPARAAGASTYRVLPDMAEVIVAANRDGPAGRVPIRFDPETMTVGDWA
jgi:replicative DNA helicase